MSELAPRDFEHLEQVGEIDRRFDLIVNNTYAQIDGPFFTEKSNFIIDVIELTKRKPITEAEQKKGIERKPPINTGKQLILEIFQQFDMIHDKSEIEKMREAQLILVDDIDTLDEDDKLLLKNFNRIIAMNDYSREILDAATEKYQVDYWDDYESNTGQDLEKLNLLYEATDPYEECNLLSAIQSIRESGGISDGIVLEADRIARILISNEINTLE